MTKNLIKYLMIFGIIFLISGLAFTQEEEQNPHQGMAMDQDMPQDQSIPPDQGMPPAQRKASVQSAAPAQGAVQSEKSGKITLELKGMDIIEVLKMIAAKGNINMVIGSDVKGKVTMFLKDVDINDALELILAANDLARDDRKGIVYIMTEKSYEQLYGIEYEDKKAVKVLQLKYAGAAEVSKFLNQIKTRVGKILIDETSNTVVIVDSEIVVRQMEELLEKIDKPTKTKVFRLNYAVAADMKEKLQDTLTKGVGKAQFDERTNTIVVTDTEDNLPRIEALIQAFDTRLKQVLIESKIVEITLTDAYSLGVDWNAVASQFCSLLDFHDFQVNLDTNFKLNAMGSTDPGFEVLIGKKNFTAADYEIMVQVLQSVGDSNILSSPRIMALNNQEAKILVGTNQPYATNTVTQGTSTTTTGTSLTFIDIGVKLYVTPTINDDSFITMKIRPEVSSTSSNYTYGSPSTTVPIVSTTQAETSVMVKDGCTIIIAGLIKDERSSTVKKVPFLGDAPFIGPMFRETDNDVVKKELVIFLTPHIVSGETDFLKQPMGPPIGEKLFTLPENITFQRRQGFDMDPQYLREEVIREEYPHDKLRIKGQKIDIDSASLEEYHYTIRKMVQNNLRLEGVRGNVAKGDTVTVAFSLKPGGALASKPRIIKSTNDVFGNIVLKAVKKSSPFPRFPMSVKEPQKDFVIDIIYKPQYKKEDKGAI